MNPCVSLFALLLLQAGPAAATPERFWNIRASDVVLVLATIITSGVMIWAVIQAPRWAVKTQWDLQLLKEEHDRRLTLFKTLMATRATPVDFRHVQSLNMIDVEFSSESAEDRAVRSGWKDYLDALNNPVGFNDPPQLERRRDLLAELLQRMGKTLKYDFDFAYLKGRVYYPQGHEEDTMTSFRMRKGLLEVLEGTKPLQMQVIQSEAAVENGTALSKAWLEIAEGKKSLKIEATQTKTVGPAATKDDDTLA